MPGDYDNPDDGLLSEVIGFFEADNWTFEVADDIPLISLVFFGQNAAIQCFAQVRELQQQFVFYSICGIFAPEPRRKAVAEFITRVNYSMVAGNFEMDFSDGEVRYKTYIDVEGTTLTHTMARNVVYPNIAMMDRYIPALVRVMYSEVAPDVAYSEGAISKEKGNNNGSNDVKDDDLDNSLDLSS